MRKLPVAAAFVVMVVTGCARDDQLSSPLASTPITIATTSSTTSTTVAASTPTSAPPTTAAVAPVSSAPMVASSAPTTNPPEVTVPATLVPATTAPAGAQCTTLAAMPADAVESGNKSLDVDADGAPDVVRTYSVGAAPVAGDWHLRVELATGQGVDLPLPDDPAPGTVMVLGGTYIGSDVDPGPGGMRPAIFVQTGSGASTAIISLYRLADDCTLVAMGGGTPFPVGASVTDAESLGCEGVAGTMLLTFHQAQLSGDGVTYEVIDTGYTREGNDLVVYGAGPQTSNSPTLPVYSRLIDCPGIDQP